MVRGMAREHKGTVKNLTSHYMACLGTYRGLYIINWIYRYMTELHYHDPISWGAGLVQTVLYIDFFYYYVKARYLGTVMPPTVHV